MVNQFIIPLLCALLLLSACATNQQSARGDLILGGGSNGGTPVYRGDIKRSYRVIKQLCHTERQLGGAIYYTDFSGAAWLSGMGKQIGADAIINYQSRRIPGAVPLLDAGWFSTSGTAVEFVDGATEPTAPPSRPFLDCDRL
jgi:hypothetical protein